MPDRPRPFERIWSNGSAWLPLAGLLLAWLVAPPAGADEPAAPLTGQRFVDNGRVRLGVDLDLGGAITFLATSRDGTNVVNSYDFGRQIQMSFYAGPIPYIVGDKQPAPHWRQLGWNPIQSGDDFGHGSRVLDYRGEADRLYVKCASAAMAARQRAGRMHLRVVDRTRRRCRPGARAAEQCPRRSHAVRRPAQELPAVYTNGPLHRLMTYNGRQPFTGAALAEIVKPANDPAPWAQFMASENWAALVRDDDWGLGVWNPGCYRFSGGFAGERGAGGPKDSPTGYIAPNLIEMLDHNIRYDFEYVLILGRLAEIREYVYRHALRDSRPNYEFRSDRQHWHLCNATDTGWPLAGVWQVKLEQDDPQLIGPAGFWQASEVPKLTIDAACHTTQHTGRVFWQRFDDSGFNDLCWIDFELRPDGEFHTYTIDLSTAANYRGAITGLRFDPVSKGGPGEWIKVRSIRAASAVQ